jgi:hypothetical protein
MSRFTDLFQEPKSTLDPVVEQVQTEKVSSEKGVSKTPKKKKFVMD